MSSLEPTRGFFLFRRGSEATESRDAVSASVSGLSRWLADTQRLDRVIGSSRERVLRAAAASLKPRRGLPEPGKWTLRDLNFELRRGIGCAVVGPRESGKSALIRILSGLDQPTTGRVWVRSPAVNLGNVGMGFRADYSVLTNASQYLRLLGIPKSDHRAISSKSIEFAKLDLQENERLGNYSRAEVTRFGMSLSLLAEPAVLLCDGRFLKAGHGEFAEACLQRVQSMISGGMTLIYSGTESAILSELCDFSLELNEGRLVQVGPRQTDISGQAVTSPRSLREVWLDANSGEAFVGAELDDQSDDEADSGEEDFADAASDKAPREKDAGPTWLKLSCRSISMTHNRLRLELILLSAVELEIHGLWIEMIGKVGECPLVLCSSDPQSLSSGEHCFVVEADMERVGEMEYVVTPHVVCCTEIGVSEIAGTSQRFRLGTHEPVFRRVKGARLLLPDVVWSRTSFDSSPGEVEVVTDRRCPPQILPLNNTCAFGNAIPALVFRTGRSDASSAHPAAILDIHRPVSRADIGLDCYSGLTRLFRNKIDPEWTDIEVGRYTVVAEIQKSNFHLPTDLCFHFGFTFSYLSSEIAHAHCFGSFTSLRPVEDSEISVVMRHSVVIESSWTYLQFGRHQ